MYECPNCGGNLKYNIRKQTLKCDHCDTTINPYDVTKECDAEESINYDVTIFTCPQCAGEILSMDETAATFCSFCGASTILDSRISKERRPAKIIPFTKTKTMCKNAYMKIANKSPFFLQTPRTKSASTASVASICLTGSTISNNRAP